MQLEMAIPLDFDGLGALLVLAGDDDLPIPVFLGDVNLNNTAAGIANSYVNDSINNAGSACSAIAIAIRWRMPPEN